MTAAAAADVRAAVTVVRQCRTVGQREIADERQVDPGVGATVQVGQ